MRIIDLMGTWPIIMSSFCFIEQVRLLKIEYANVLIKQIFDIIYIRTHNRLFYMKSYQRNEEQVTAFMEKLY